MEETRYAHIVLDKNKVPTISGTTMKVVELVSARLVYYWDHCEELDQDIDRRLEKVDKLRLATDYSLICGIRVEARSSKRRFVPHKFGESRENNQTSKRRRLLRGCSVMRQILLPPMMMIRKRTRCATSA